MILLVHIPLLSFFSRPQPGSTPADPLHCDVPALHDAEIAAVYYDHRIAGDFYEFLREIGRAHV